MNDVYLIVMAGGSGTRFWPKSTPKKPKQLLSFGGNKESLLEQTLNRFRNDIALEQTYIVTTESLTPSIRKIVSPKVKVLSEPAGRNTAPCVFWATEEVKKKNPNAIMLILPSDHFIANEKQFHYTIQTAIQWARSHPDQLITLGVKPTRPETGYGYLKVREKNSSGALSVEKFVEKPDLERAKQYCSDSSYYWNGGMFVWNVKAISQAFAQYMPEMGRVWDEARGDIQKAYPKLTATSIDYGVMEKSSHVMTFPLDCGWDDLGSWTSLENLGKILNLVRAEGVVVNGNSIALESSGNIVDVPAEKRVALIGAQNLIVVDTGESLLICEKSKAQDIKKIVELIQSQK